MEPATSSPIPAHSARPNADIRILAAALRAVNLPDSRGRLAGNGDGECGRRRTI